MAKLKSLKLNPKNPRVISEAKLEALKKAMKEFGDLGGFVYNRRTKQLVGGHQRSKAFPPSAEVVIERKLKKKSKTGTVAEGYVELEGERHKYREVDWDDTIEKAANIAANKGAGEWDEELLAEFFTELGDFGIDLDLTMFADDEIKTIVDPTLNHDFQPGSKSEQGKLDEKKKAVCPNCGESFSVAGRK